MYTAFKELLKLKSNIKIHIVAEGAGAILLGELLRTLSENGEEKTISRIAALTLLTPSCTRVAFEPELRKWRELHNLPILLLVPVKDAKLTLGLYQGSVLDLVEKSFGKMLAAKLWSWEPRRALKTRR